MLKQVIEIFDLIDDADVNCSKVAEFFTSRNAKMVVTKTVKCKQGTTGFIKITVPGQNGKVSGGKAPTLGIIGRLGGVGVRPNKVGVVSDADGAIVTLSCALKLLDMQKKGDPLEGDVILATQICPSALMQPHKPVPFVTSPADMMTINAFEVDKAMDAILCVDTTKANRIVKWRGFAISPTVKEGWILKVSDDLITIMEWVTGRVARVLPLTMQDITPYENGIYHINSIMQPATVTDAPVVGVAITTEVPVPGCSTGSSHIVDIEEASRFCIEVAKAFSKGECNFYDKREFDLIKRKYGSMKHLLTVGDD